jgi:hypothetical protein
MGKKVKLLCRLILIALFSFGSINHSYGQEKINISTGIGIPEFLNIGIRYQFKQVQAGICIGTMPVKDEKLISLCGDLFFHFGEVPKLSARRAWYARVGLNYLRDATETSEDRFTYLNIRFGRDLNISKKVGIEIDLGTLIQLSYKRIGPSSFIDFNFPILPSVGINMFFRL